MSFSRWKTFLPNKCGTDNHDANESSLPESIPAAFLQITWQRRQSYLESGF